MCTTNPGIYIADVSFDIYKKIISSLTNKVAVEKI